MSSHIENLRAKSAVKTPVKGAELGNRTKSATAHRSSHKKISNAPTNLHNIEQTPVSSNRVESLGNGTRASTLQSAGGTLKHSLGGTNFLSSGRNSVEPSAVSRVSSSQTSVQRGRDKVKSLSVLDLQRLRIPSVTKRKKNE